MNSRIIEKIENNRMMIVIEIIILLLLVYYAFFAFRQSRANDFDTSTIPIVSKDEGYDYSIENVSKPKLGVKYYVDVKGWAVEKGVKSRSSDTISVVLKNVDTGNYYYIPTMRQMRKDVTRHFYDGIEYDDSGFEAKVSFSKEVNADSSEYEIFVYLENKKGKKLINTNTKFNEWINSNAQ